MLLLINMKYEHLYLLYSHKTVEIHLFLLNVLSAHCFETDIVRVFQKVDHLQDCWEQITDTSAP